MNRRLGWYAALTLMLAHTAVARGGLVNEGFETGDLTGWTAVLNGGSATVITDHIGDLGVLYHPPERNYQLKIMGGGANVWQTVSQSVSLTAGQKLEGYAAFDWHDYAPFYDETRVRILDSGLSELAVPYSHDGVGLPNYADHDVEYWSWIAPADGLYILEYSARNTLDGALTSVALFDSAIPEPTTLVLALLGALGLSFRTAARLRKKR